jgi:hypothetical protein
MAMKSNSKFVLAVTFASALGLHAQTGGSPFAGLKANYDAVKSDWQKMAEQMPEENYSFKPTPEMRSFGQLVAHVADVQAQICSAVSGDKKSVNAGSKTAKADLVAALKDSSAICDAAYDSLTEAAAGQPGGMGKTKLGLLDFNFGHTNEEYGYGSVYLRLKNVVPPSSAGRGGR